VTTARSPLRGSAFLVGAALFWGFGFLAQRWSLTSLPPLWATSARLVLAVPLAVLVIGLRRSAGLATPWRTGLVCGLLLYVAFALQTVAMLHTPVSRVALITGLYGVFTPLLQPFFGLQRPRALQVVAVVVATAGTALLCGVFADEAARSAPPNIGDALTLVMAVVSAFYVIFLSQIATKTDALSLSGVQVLAMSLGSVVVAPFFEGAPPLSWDAPTWASVLYLAVFSTYGAFLLQMLGQQHVSPSTAAVLMLLETPIGVGSAVAFLKERMTGLQWAGAVLAIVAVVLAVIAEQRAARDETPLDSEAASSSRPSA
jgi:drug/metabolite transporter (DMT)-like permease